MEKKCRFFGKLNNVSKNSGIYSTRKTCALLYLFIDRYKSSQIKELASFATGLEKDISAVENAVASDLSNGFVEGTNSKLKMVKRTMYGRV